MTPSQSAAPASIASPSASSVATSIRVWSRATASAPAARSRATGTSAAQQCTTRAPDAATDEDVGQVVLGHLGRHRADRSVAGRGGDPRVQRGRQRRLVQLERRASPRAAGWPCPAGAAGRPRAPTRPGRGWRPGSEIARWPLGSSIEAARVIGPATWTFNVPTKPSPTCSTASRSRASRSRARRRSIPGRPARRQPDGSSWTGRSTSNAALATDQIRARTAGRQLGQERQIGQLVEDQPRGLGRVVAGQRSDPGGRAGRPGVGRR